MHSFTRTATMKVLAIFATLSLVHLSTDAQNYDAFAATLVRASGGCSQTIIIRLSDHALQAATNGFFVDPAQRSAVVKGFLQPNDFTTLSVGNITYTKIKADGRTIHGTKSPGGLVCGSSRYNCVCCVYTGTAPSLSSIASLTVGYITNYFYQVGM